MSTPSFNLAGRRALITGSSQGIGLALARGLAVAGAHVILNGRAAVKAGLLQLTRAMALEWAPHNIQANAIAPGYMLTPLNESLVADPQFDAWIRSRTPAGRWGQPDELVGATLLFASPASDFITGQILYIDGGLTIAI